MPNPVIAKNNKFLFSICGNAKNPIAASNKHTACTFLGLYFFAYFTNAKATKKVTALYQPLTNPVQLAASS